MYFIHQLPKIIQEPIIPMMVKFLDGTFSQNLFHIFRTCPFFIFLPIFHIIQMHTKTEMVILLS